MKKFLAIICGLLLIGAAANAQSGLFSLGVKGGMGLSDYKLGDNLGNTLSTDQKASWHVGAMFRTNIPVLPIYVQAEALYSQVGGTVNFNDPLNPQGSFSNDITVNRLDIPLLVGLKFGLLGINGRVYGGGVAQTTLSDNFSDISNDIKVENFVWGYQAGVGVDIKKLTIDVKYEGGSDLITEQTGAPSIKSSQWLLSLGWFFGSND
ncbi:PorT family protein [Flammeovirga yaeyamensis]|uniref:PorT family protein n=1 Tax=Flammeovirga yaeyamensis TaxID=367791 RepID=A0AAX1N5D7_9BACT|nr:MULTISPECIES: porin family protein [Flammeovirga]ANQ47511.1 PorT family protein [Flammeovirga sp. MY04]MBB3698550.1 hypothetical protein [Flammeovirga yaeyamensis]NMF34101.1 PorT family protein [Flammeovirga yaeyamensis]QWG01088.1 PorT family protein [Flammeovirga yaeyamensis]